MAHHKRKRARVNQRTGSKNDVKRKYGTEWFWYRQTPAWWNITYHNRPRRAEERRLAAQIKKGEDPDDISWPLAKKPHKYYW